MMKNILKKQKGISLVVLVITITVLVIITNVLIYNLRDNLGIENVKAMQNDIANLRDKVASYYNQYGKLPINEVYKYTNIDAVRGSGVISEQVDTGDFYVIDLNSIENLTLNNGKDYKNLTLNLTQNEINEFTDLYIINENSGNIFYVKGVEINGNIYYTDYNKEDIDTKGVDLRYVEGVKIPAGFYYVGGSKDEGIVISDVQGDDLENTKHGNQFVWVPVDKTSFDTVFKRVEGYFNGELDIFLPQTGEADRNGGNSYLQVNGIYESATTQKEAQEMYKSVKNYGGFYIGRFEAGKDSSGNVISQKGVTVYNNIKCGNSLTDDAGGALEKARGMYTDKTKYGVTSTLCYGVQWDATLNFIDPNYITNEVNGKPNCSYNSYVRDSTGKGNYSDEDASNNPGLTGNKSEYEIKNIYDMAGNLWEYTMETYGTYKRIARGGGFTATTNTSPSSRRTSYTISKEYEHFGFRVTLYLNIDSEWSEAYDKEGIYTDENGDKAYIPAGFSVNKVENTINNGLVVKDSNNNEYVWIPVPVSVTKDLETEAEIEQKLIDYVGDYRRDGFTNEWVEGCGLTQTDFNNLKKRMLLSIQENGGFYIGRYEAGTDVARTSGTTSDSVATLKSTHGLPKSQKDKYLYNYVGVGQAQQLANSLSINGYETSLLFNIQWDLVCKFMEQSKQITKYEIITDSVTWGNYQDAEFSMLSGYYWESNTYVEVSGIYNKSKEGSKFISTGSSDRNKVLNIYDFAGNEWEWVLGKSSNATAQFIRRGGEANYVGTECPAIQAGSDNMQKLYFSRSFRVALYK